MISLGLSAEDERLFNQSLTRSHEVAFRIHALDLNQSFIEDLSNVFIDGQVNYDSTKQPNRDVSLTFVSRALFSFESRGALTTGAGFAQIMVSVEYGVRSDLLDRWVWVPLFTGPVTQFERDSDEVIITAEGKEQLLATASTWETKTYPKGTRKVALVRDVLASHGEAFFDFPEWTTKIDKAETIRANDQVWGVAMSCARSWGHGLLAYDGRGRCKLFNPTTNVRWVFQDGHHGSVMTEPQVTYSLDSNFVNAARVYGPTPAKGKKQIFSQRVAPASHPLSPQSLGRNGIPVYYAKVEPSAQVSTQAEADKLAQSYLDAGLIGAVTASFESVPIPHLELFDTVSLQTSHYSTSFRVQSFSIPLNVTSNMTVGYTAKVSRFKKHGKRYHL